MSPDNYFKEDKLLTLDDSKEYETIKKELKDIYKKYPEKIKILGDFQINYKDQEYDYIHYLRNVKRKIISDDFINTRRICDRNI